MTQASIPNSPHSPEVLDPQARDFYIHTFSVLGEAGIPFLLGGAYAFAQYTGIERHTRDLDIFVRPADAAGTLAALRQAGYETSLTFPHWLGKAHCGADYVDVIFNSGNGVCPVDEDWFSHAEKADVFGIPVQLMPAEEMIWQKSMILERERYDGADVAHILRARAERLDWSRLLNRFGPNWRVLLSHLILFGFIYPSERHRLPQPVLQGLLDQLHREQHGPASQERVCRGTILSREQYLMDITHWGYGDARVVAGHMQAHEVSQWTDAIERRPGPGR